MLALGLFLFGVLTGTVVPFEREMGTVVAFEQERVGGSGGRGVAGAQPVLVGASGAARDAAPAVVFPSTGSGQAQVGFWEAVLARLEVRRAQVVGDQRQTAVVLCALMVVEIYLARLGEEGGNGER